MKLIIDAWYWLTEDGSLPLEPRERRQALRIARLIEYGGPLDPGEKSETLVECSRRPKRKRCSGLLYVEKLPSDVIRAYCMACREEEIYVHGWQTTDWADGPVPPPPPAPVGATLH